MFHWRANCQLISELVGNENRNRSAFRKYQGDAYNSTVPNKSIRRTL